MATSAAAASSNCPGCGATWTAGAQWCSLCFHRLGQGLAHAHPGVSPGQGSPAPTAGWGSPAPTAVPSQPGARFAAAADLSPPPRYSRWLRTPTTMGPVGRVGWTVAIFALPGVILAMSFGMAGYGFAAIWLGVVAPMALRSVWAKGQLDARLTGSAQPPVSGPFRHP